MSLYPLGGFVESFPDVIVANGRFWCDGSHQVCKYQLEEMLDLVIKNFEMSQLVAIPQGAKVCVQVRSCRSSL